MLLQVAAAAKVLQYSYYPEFNQVNLSNYELVNGFGTLGFLKKHRSDCIFITQDQWQDYNDYTWLDQLIKLGLSQGKIVCIVPWDESIINPDGHSKLSVVLNKYIDDPVWMITQLEQEDQDIYTFQHGIRCKIIEIPWWLLNDCLSYYAVTDHIKTEISQQNYLCMLNRFESHKWDLALALKKHHLDTSGLITVRHANAYPKENLEFCQVNKKIPYSNYPGSLPIVGAATKINDVWISNNVENFLFIEKEYSNIPLIINPETTCGIFFSTEKSLWPLLLGKLMLIYGRPGAMRYMQRFYDIDFSIYANLEFDQPSYDWSDKGHQDRLELLINKNRSLIQDCTSVYQTLQPKLESARWTLGSNMYKFFISQLDKIQ